MGQETLVVLVIFVVVAAVGSFLYYRQGGGSDASTAVASLPPPPPPPPLTAAESQAKLAQCQRRGLAGVGTCTLDPATNEYKLQCHTNRYGANCAQTCRVGGTKKTEYTAGFEGAGAGAATCACPSQYNFKNRSVTVGCSSGTEQGSACVAGYHGPDCDEMGSWMSCGTGVQDPTTGKCDCKNGFVGDHCQYNPTHCTSKDKGAKMDPMTGACTCSDEWSGAQCTNYGYITNKDGVSKPWTEVWTDMSKETVTFTGAGTTPDWGKQSCQNSNNCTQTAAICSLLAADEGNIKGCSSIESMCNDDIVETSYGRCSLYEKGGLDNGLGTPWFKSVTVPQNIEYAVWKSDDCSGDATVSLKECTNEAGCTYTASDYRANMSFQFQLPPGSYAKCGAKYYLGPKSDDSGDPPSDLPGAVYSQASSTAPSTTSTAATATSSTS